MFGLFGNFGDMFGGAGSPSPDDQIFKSKSKRRGFGKGMAQMNKLMDEDMMEDLCDAPDEQQKETEKRQ